jgi:hypothetical protein
MNKTTVLIESLGERVRLTIQDASDEVSRIMFANLRWLCTKRETDILDEIKDYDQFTTEREQLAKAIKAYRSVNQQQGRRGKQLWKSSPFLFKAVSQQNGQTKGLPTYKQGENQDFSDLWAGFESRLTKLFDN